MFLLLLETDKFLLGNKIKCKINSNVWKQCVNLYNGWRLSKRKTAFTFAALLCIWATNFKSTLTFTCNLGLNLSFHRSSQRRCSVRKGALRNFAKFTGKHLWQSPFFNEVAGLQAWPATSLKKRLWYRCFSVNFAQFLRTHLDDCFCLQKRHGSIPSVLSGFKD